MTAHSLDLETIREALTESETNLLQKLQTGQDSPVEPVSQQDESDLGLLYHHWVENRTLSSREEERLGQIQAALQRLETGTYGKCRKCGEPINPERLYSIPYAEYCISCQRKQEDPLF